MTNRNSKDLLVAVALALFATAAIFLQVHNPVVLLLLGLPLVLLLPGYTLATLLFPKGDLGFPEMLACSLGLSLAIDIAGGLVLNLTPQGLAVLPWTVFLAGVTLGCAVVALSRRNRLETTATHSRIRLGIGQIILLGASIMVVVTAVMLVRNQAAQPSTRFTELWARPDSAQGQTVFDIGLRNSESSKLEYKLEVKVGEDLVYDSSAIALIPGQTWEKAIALPLSVNAEVRALLYRMDDPGTVYREVVLSRGGKQP